ncbi:hypothetical protein PLICRDRAFT_179588 [Plicaturopsis crispa FD-325 SS-3]|uniref:Uncharacterized protein n=1 Tax=Plicaturopsis crispa FD-325 SS-3 TaxID=944288 RepID=A0A0C9SKU3_PLICR|nr:hypothetical protein PLICRDRAFT_179588 [Plicaturopsis crispa FD-325 SS-3]
MASPRHTQPPLPDHTALSLVLCFGAMMRSPRCLGGLSRACRIVTDMRHWYTPCPSLGDDAHVRYEFIGTPWLGLVGGTLARAQVLYVPQCVRPDSLSNNASTSRQVAAASKPAPVVDLPALPSASCVLQDQFVKDAQSVSDLGETLATPGSQSSASYSVFPDDYKVPYV